MALSCKQKHLSNLTAAAMCVCKHRKPHTHMLTCTPRKDMLCKLSPLSQMYVWFQFRKGNLLVGHLKIWIYGADCLVCRVTGRFFCLKDKFLIKELYQVWPSVAWDYWKSAWWHTEHHWAQEEPTMNLDLSSHTWECEMPSLWQQMWVQRSLLSTHE